MFGIVIDCEQHGRYHYYIANPEVLSEGELRTWLLETYGDGRNKRIAYIPQGSYK